jgi:hypothetical protein
MCLRIRAIGGSLLNSNEASDSIKYWDILE